MRPDAPFEQNSITSSSFHNLTAHFNGYFYAKEGALEVTKWSWKSLETITTKSYLLYPRLDYRAGENL